MQLFGSLWRLLITIVFAAVFAFFVPVFVDGREYTKAVYNLTENPTPENGATVARLSVKYRRIALITHLAAGSVLFVLINVGWSLFAPRSAKPSESSMQKP
jgi:hypothetical protein